MNPTSYQAHARCMSCHFPGCPWLTAGERESESEHCGSRGHHQGCSLALSIFTLTVSSRLRLQNLSSSCAPKVVQLFRRPTQGEAHPSRSVVAHSIPPTAAPCFPSPRLLFPLLRSTLVLIPQSIRPSRHARHARLEAGPHLAPSRVDILVLITLPLACLLPPYNHTRPQYISSFHWLPLLSKVFLACTDPCADIFLIQLVLNASFSLHSFAFLVYKIAS